LDINVRVRKELHSELDKWKLLYSLDKQWMVEKAVEYALNFPETVWGIKENKFIKEGE
jgi:hypothetical protein